MAIMTVVIAARRYAERTVHTSDRAANTRTDNGTDRSRRAIAAPCAFIHAADNTLRMRDMRNSKHRCKSKRGCQQKFRNAGSASGHC